MSDFKLPDLPSDEELGIEGLSEDDFTEPPPPPPPGDAPPAPPKAAEDAAPPAPAGAPRWSGWVTLLVLVLGAWFSSASRQIPSPLPATAPDTIFASGRALPALVEIAREPRPTGSTEHVRVRELLLERLSELGLASEVQTATSVTTSVTSARGSVRSATVRNIVARLPGEASTGGVLITAHYDGVPASPAAADDGSGVAAILETIRAVTASGPLRNDLIVLITDAEELGLLGARAFVDQHPWMSDVQVVLGLEMRGSRGPSVMFETGRDNGWIIEQLKRFDPAPVANSATVAVYRTMPNDTDFSPFRDAGVQGLNFAAIGAVQNYHQPTDTPANLGEGTLQHHGERLTAAVRWLGDADLSDPSAPDRMYVGLPFLGLVTLPASLAIPATLGLILALLLVTFLASVRGARSRGFLAAAILSTTAVALSAGAGWALVHFVLPLHSVAGTGTLYNEVPYRIALVAVALASVTGLFAISHRWMSPLEATLGALFLPVLALLTLTLLAPLAVVDLQLPMAATVLLLALLTGVGLHRARGTVAWVLSLLLALPVLAVLVPLLELFFQALTLSAAPTLAGATAAALLLILPALSATAVPNRWWMPAGALLVAALSSGWALLQRTPSASRPLPTALVYTMDRSEQGIPATARWIATEVQGWPTAIAGSGAGTATPGSGRFTAVTAEVRDAVAGLSVGTGDQVWADAPLAALPTPEIAVLSDEQIGASRLITLGLRSRGGAEVLAVNAPEGVEILSVNGAPEQGAAAAALPAAVRTVEHWGDPEGLLVLELSARSSARWPLEIVETFYTPEALFGEEPFQRPAGFIERGGYGADRALIRTIWSPGVSLSESVPSVPGRGPQGAAGPGGEVTPDAVAGPDTVSGADTTAAPETTAGPDTAATPDTTSGLETVPGPDTTANPDTVPAPGTPGAMSPGGRG
jgi:hypothetical protein